MRINVGYLSSHFGLEAGQFSDLAWRHVNFGLKISLRNRARNRYRRALRKPRAHNPTLDDHHDIFARTGGRRWRRLGWEGGARPGVGCLDRFCPRPAQDRHEASPASSKPPMQLFPPASRPLTHTHRHTHTRTRAHAHFQLGGEGQRVPFFLYPRGKNKNNPGRVTQVLSFQADERQPVDSTWAERCRFTGGHFRASGAGRKIWTAYSCTTYNFVCTTVWKVKRNDDGHFENFQPRILSLLQIDPPNWRRAGSLQKKCHYFNEFKFN